MYRGSGENAGTRQRSERSERSEHVGAGLMGKKRTLHVLYGELGNVYYHRGGTLLTLSCCGLKV